MEVLEDLFLYQAALTLCKHLYVDSFLADSRQLLQQHSPIDKLVFTRFHLDTSILEVISIADRVSVRNVSVKINVSAEIVKKITQIGPPIQVARRSSALLQAKLLTRRGILSGDASVAIIRLVTDSGLVCLLFCTSQPGQEITREHGPLLTGFRPIFTVAAENCLKARNLLLKHEKLQEDIVFLSSFQHDHIGTEVVGSDMGLKLVMAEVRSIAASNEHVSMSGEQGVGKKFIAQIIHQLSARQNRPFIEINCHGTSESQLEKLFFGNETHMVRQLEEKDKGMLARAAGGTVYLKGAERMSGKLQKRVQEVIRNKILIRCHGQQRTRCDIRFVMLLNSNVRADNLLLEDLAVNVIQIPPLRDRKEDIARLAAYFADQACHKLNKKAGMTFDRDSLMQCQTYDWPGNVSELRLMVERAVLLAEGDIVTLRELTHREEITNDHDESGDEELQLDAVIIKHISRVMHRTRGKIGGPDGAAHLLGINPSTLRKRMRKLKIPFGRKATY